MKKIKYQISDEFIELLKTSIYFVEANSNEELNLWEKHNEEMKWDEKNAGFSLILGYIGKPKNNRTVNVHFRFVKLHGYPVCFYDAISRFVDHTMVEDFIKEYGTFKKDKWPMTDAMNFHHVIHEVARRKEKRNEKKKTKKAELTH